MNFKSDREKIQFEDVSLILQLIAKDLEFAISALGKEMLITRVSDAIEGESGVHLDKRALDVRDEFMGQMTFTDEEISLILKTMNQKWARNDGLQTVIHHKFQGGPYHLHIQIPISTKVYEKIKSI